MFGNGTRRDFLAHTGSLAAAGAIAAACRGRPDPLPARARTISSIVEGHRDMWELSGRTRLQQPDQHLPITNFLAKRLIDGGITVCILPAGGGDSLEERDGTERCSTATCACST